MGCLEPPIDGPGSQSVGLNHVHPIFGLWRGIDVHVYVSSDNGNGQLVIQMACTDP